MRVLTYGSSLKRSDGSVEVVPKDGLRTRFYIVRGTSRAQLTLGRDVFAKDQPVTFDDSLEQINFQLENRGGGAHDAVLHLRGMLPGSYCATVNGTQLTGESLDVTMPVAATGTTRVTVRHR